MVHIENNDTRLSLSEPFEIQTSIDKVYPEWMNKLSTTNSHY